MEASGFSLPRDKRIYILDSSAIGNDADVESYVANSQGAIEDGALFLLTDVVLKEIDELKRKSSIKKEVADRARRFIQYLSGKCDEGRKLSGGVELSGGARLIFRPILAIDDSSIEECADPTDKRLVAYAEQLRRKGYQVTILSADGTIRIACSERDIPHILIKEKPAYPIVDAS